MNLDQDGSYARFLKIYGGFFQQLDQKVMITGTQYQQYYIFLITQRKLEIARYISPLLTCVCACAFPLQFNSNVDT